jgi:hypothetical protein
LLLPFDGPFAESGDHDSLTLAQLILDDFKEFINDTDAVFLGNTEVYIIGFDKVNFLSCSLSFFFEFKFIYFNVSIMKILLSSTNEGSIDLSIYPFPQGYERIF